MEDIEKVLVTAGETELASLTINAEILNRIPSLRDDASYLIRPQTFVRATIASIYTKEKNLKIKEKLEELLFR